jgi:hypothetical protein
LPGLVYTRLKQLKNRYITLHEWNRQRGKPQHSCTYNIARLIAGLTHWRTNLRWRIEGLTSEWCALLTSWWFQYGWNRLLWFFEVKRKTILRSIYMMLSETINA